MVEASQQSNAIRGEGQLLQAMVAHWAHEDRLFWNQIQYLLTFQLALLAGWYSLGPSLLSACAMLAAAAITRHLYRLAMTVARNRDANVPAIQIVATSLLTNESREAIDRGDHSGLFRLTTHPLSEPDDAGRRFQRQFFVGCILLNMALGAVTFHDAYSTPSVGWLRHVHPRLERNGGAVTRDHRASAPPSVASTP